MIKNIILLSLIPSIAFASGGQVLSLFWSSLIVLLIVSMSLIVSKMALFHKVAIFITYIVASVISFAATADMPYGKNQEIIIVINTVIPLFTWFIVFKYYENKKT